MRCFCGMWSSIAALIIIRAAIEAMKRVGPEYPQILHMFSFKMQATVHLERFTQEMMREAAPLSPGIRELIAAYTSRLNQCPF